MVRLGDGARQMPLEADGVAIAARDVGEMLADFVKADDGALAPALGAREPQAQEEEKIGLDVVERLALQKDRRLDGIGVRLAREREELLAVDHEVEKEVVEAAADQVLALKQGLPDDGHAHAVEHGALEKLHERAPCVELQPARVAAPEARGLFVIVRGVSRFG